MNDITVFVETIGNLRVVQQCFPPLLQTCPKDFPIFILDSQLSETDGTRDFLIQNRDKRTTLYLSNMNHKRWAAMHQLVPYVKTDYILCISSDVLFNGEEWGCPISQIINKKSDRIIVSVANFQAGCYKNRSSHKEFQNKQFLLTFNFWGVFVIFRTEFLRRFLKYFTPFHSTTSLNPVRDIMSNEEKNRINELGVMTDSMSTLAHILFTTNISNRYCYEWLPVAFNDSVYNYRILRKVEFPIVGEHLPTPISSYLNSFNKEDIFISGDPKIEIIK